jgi:RNA polymerase sigma-70 factor (ECF subfamily)
MTDEELAMAVQAGNPDMFGPLLERYEEKLLRYGRKFLREPEDIRDIVQDVLVSAYQNIQSFDAGQRFSPWIYRIAHNAFVNELRRKSRNPLVYVDFDTFLAHPAYEDPMVREREQAEVRAMIEKSLENLDYKYREVLILYYLEDLSYKDIADVLEVPQGTVGVRLKRAKAALRKAFDTLHPHGI